MSGSHIEYSCERICAVEWQNRGMDRHRQSADAACGALCQIAVMQREIRRFLAAFAVLGLAALGGTAHGQVQGGGPEWDTGARNSPSVPAVTPGNQNALLDQLNKILGASQINPTDRTFYLSVRAFLLSRLGRDADSQKDIAEMGRIAPKTWPIMIWSTMPSLAGGGDRAAALRTLDFSLTQKPNDSWLLVAQAQVLMQIADYTKAVGALDGAVASAVGPIDRRLAVFYRGQASFNLGNFQQAAEDFDASLEGLNGLKLRLNGDLWRYAAQVHTRQDARAVLNKDIGNENLYEWPGPIARFLLGKMTAGELEVAAESDDAAKKTNGKCPASFFMGMEAVRRGDKQRAREQLQLTQARCPTSSTYNWAAASELKRL
jgi:tetratricopeptide (TPR) repeat protein